MVDAIMLDLPAPWLVVEDSFRCLKPYGNICTFSPAIEQVQATTKVLTDVGFQEVRTVECLDRPYDVNPREIEEIIDPPSLQRAGFLGSMHSFC